MRPFDRLRRGRATPESVEPEDVTPEEIEPEDAGYDAQQHDWEERRTAERREAERRAEARVAAHLERIRTEGLLQAEITSMRPYQVSIGAGGWTVEAHVTWDSRAIRLAHGFSSQSAAAACERMLSDHLLRHGVIHITTEPGVCRP